MLEVFIIYYCLNLDSYDKFIQRIFKLGFSFHYFFFFFFANAIVDGNVLNSFSNRINGLFNEFYWCWNRLERLNISITIPIG